MAISMKTTSGKLLASAGLVAAAAAVAGLGTYGGFTSSTSASTDVASGTVAINLANAGQALKVPAAGVLPGDTIERVVALSNDGDQNLASITLAATDSTPSVLTSDRTLGLQLKVESCATPWTGTPGSYNCAGGATTVVSKSAILGTRDLGNLTSLTAKKSDNLKITATLPTDADNTFQGKTSTINFAFSGIQRGAETK
jgi:spore coat-associated protein N